MRLTALQYVDMDRLGMMGWSHGGFITAHTLFRDEHPFNGLREGLLRLTLHLSPA